MIQRKNKKAVTAVVATALIIVVAVVSVIGFQSWFGAFSSKTFVNVEQNSKQADSNSQIETLVGDELYFKNNLEDNLSIKQIKVNGKICNIPITNLSLGVESISLQNCTENLTTNVADIVIITNNKIFNKKVFLKDVEIDNTEVMSCINITNNLTNLYHLDGNWQDDSINPYNGIPQNGVTFTSNKKIGSNAAIFDGVNQYVNISGPTLQSFTTSVWFKLNDMWSPTERTTTLLLQGDGLIIGNCARMPGVINSQTIDIGFYTTEDNWIKIDSGIIPTLNTWYHIAATLNSSNKMLTFYLNGNKIGNITHTSNTYSGYFPNFLGLAYSDGNTQYFNGLMDEIAIYNEPLTQEEITQIYQGGLNNKPICDP